MHYSVIKTTDIANGPGVRVSLFVSGCRNKCKGCFNPETWDFSNGNRYTKDTETEIINALIPKHISGLSILGGDPMEPENYTAVTELCYWVKMLFPKKSIWVYTGYLWEDLKDLEIMTYIDVLVDGPFIEGLKDISLRFRGSQNQRIIDVKRSIRKSDIYLYDF